MGIFNTLRNELVDVIEWVDDGKRSLLWRFPRYQNEIKNGARLIVRPGQQALFVDQGRVADFFEPGGYELQTQNLPVLSKLRGWKYGFESPFKCEVYFVSTRTLTGLKWRTPNPILLRDAEFGPVRLHAFGNLTLRALDAQALLRELVGTDGIFEAEEVAELLRAVIASAFADVIGETEMGVLDLAGKYAGLGEAVRRRVCERLDDEYGLNVPALQILNISLPEAVEKAIDTRCEMRALGDMNSFQQYQMAHAVVQAAQNPRSGAALGMDWAMASQMARAMSASAFGDGVVLPPTAAVWYVTENGQNFGPYGLEQLARAAQQNTLTPNSLVWSAGMAGWTQAGEVLHLAGLFIPPPPPPPPATGA